MNVSGWILLALAMAVVAAAALLLDAWLERRARGSISVVETHVQRMTCPITQEDVEVTFVETPEGEPIAVARCSAFVFPDYVTCTRSCLKTRPAAEEKAA